MLNDVRNFDYVSGPHTGVVAGLWKHEGYGFIKPDTPGDDIYFQTGSMRSSVRVAAGNRVQYSKWKMNIATSAVMQTQAGSKFADRAVICGEAPHETEPQAWRQRLSSRPQLRTWTPAPPLPQRVRDSDSGSRVDSGSQKTSSRRRWRPRRSQHRQQNPSAAPELTGRVARGPPTRCMRTQNFAARKKRAAEMSELSACSSCISDRTAPVGPESVNGGTGKTGEGKEKTAVGRGPAKKTRGTEGETWRPAASTSCRKHVRGGSPVAGFLLFPPSCPPSPSRCPVVTAIEV